MIFFGTRSTGINTEKIPNYKCISCEKLNTTNLTIFSKYVHIYWIPLFPYGKTAAIICENCGLEQRKNKFSDELNLAYANIKVNGKTPIWHFIGLFVITAIILLATGMISNSISSTKKTRANNLKYFNEPKVNDIYSVKLENNDFSLMKIGKITTDSIFVYHNKLVVDKKYNNHEINIPSNYESDMYAFSNEKLLELFNKRIIYKIKRE